jgi:predicted metal-dependent phosphoesterase TrpH
LRLALALAVAVAVALAAALAPPDGVAPEAAAARAPEALLDGVPREPAEGGPWRAGALHLHTHTGNAWRTGRRIPVEDAYSPDGLKALLEGAAREGLDWIAVTDHNAIDAWFDPAFRPVGPTIPIGAEEWTTFGGHAGLLGFQAEGPEDVILPGRVALPSPAQYRSAIDETHRRGGIVIIHHPDANLFKWPDDPHGADAVEVLRRSIGVERGVAWWHERLRRGHRLVAVGGSDHHQSGPRPTRASSLAPLTVVRSDAKEASAIIQAIGRGHVQVRRTKESPRVLLGVDQDGDGRFDDAAAGDVVTVAPGDALRVQVRVLGGAGLTLLAVGPEGSLGERVLAADDEAVAIALPLPANAGRTFVRVEVRDEDGGIESLSNPVYVQVRARRAPPGGWY